MSILLTLLFFPHWNILPFFHSPSSISGPIVTELVPSLSAWEQSLFSKTLRWHVHSNSEFCHHINNSYCVKYFSYCCEEISSKSNLRTGGLIFVSWFKGLVHSIVGVLPEECEAPGQLNTPRKKRWRMLCPFCVQSRTPAYGLLLPAPQLG